MPTPSLSIIVPTTGRSTLQRTLDSIACQPEYDPAEDEVIVVGSGFDMNEVYGRWPYRGTVDLRLVWMKEPGGNWGKTEREFGMLHAGGAYLMFLDDDDGLMPAAIRQVKKAIRRNPRVPILFRAIIGTGLILWREPELRMGNFGSNQFVVPNARGKLGQWTERYEGDFDFARSTVDLYPTGSLVFDSAIIAGARSFAHPTHLHAGGFRD